MNKLKGTGIHTRKTEGAIGDIYTDTHKGKQYKIQKAKSQITTRQNDYQ